MNDFDKKNASSSGQDGDGIRIIEHGGSRATLFYTVLAMILVVCFAVYFLNSVIRGDSKDSTNSPSSAAVSDNDISGSNEISESNASVSNRSDGKITARSAGRSTSNNPNDPNDLANYVAPGQAPRMEEVIQRLNEAGVYSGLGAFNPPGTSPPMIGMAVPEDYVLPEGYVRHYQATDDGQRIEPILMYSPDYVFFDSNGVAIVIPENRVVPDNRAPPGLVIRPIQIPEPLEPGGP